MHQNFKFKSDEIRGNNPTYDTRDDLEKEYRKYSTDGNARQISLILSDNTKHSFNYSYKVKTSCTADAQTLEIMFTSHRIVIIGIRLSILYYDLLHDLPIELFCSDKRYNQTVEKNMFVINDITVESI